MWQVFADFSLISRVYEPNTSSQELDKGLQHIPT